MKWKGTKGRRAKRRIAHEVEGGASGALAGAVVGAPAGGAGVLAGAVIGGVAGALTGAVLDEQAAKQSLRTRELDAEIGVSGGELGSPNLEHPPATVGAYSAASAGVGSLAADQGQPAEGPFQAPTS